MVDLESMDLPEFKPTACKTRMLEMVSQRQPNIICVGDLCCHGVEKSRRFYPMEQFSNQVMCNYGTSQVNSVKRFSPIPQ